MLAFGQVSGGHFNPAITLGNVLAGRIGWLHGAAYIGAQLIGALLGALALFGVVRTVPAISDSRAAFDTVTAGFGEHSAIQAPLAGVLLLEVVGAVLLVAVFLGASPERAGSRLAGPFAVGLSLAVLLQLGQSIGNAPFNPARATASALFSSSWSVEQLWLFWVAPLMGAVIAGLAFRGIGDAAPVSKAPSSTDSTDAGPADSTEAGLSSSTDAGPADSTEAGLSSSPDAGADSTEAGLSSSPDAGSADSTEAGLSSSPDAGPADSTEAGLSSSPDAGADEARDFFDGKKN
jgi:aquaporin Z